MKELKYMIFAVVCTLFASCMGDSYADPEVGENPFGNNALTETNVLTVKQLKDKYASIISSSGMTEVTEDIQIKGWVTGNDIGSNIYNEFAIQDETGALLICVNQSGLYGFLPVGQQVLISLKGLMIGGYGMMPEIGGIYTNTKTGEQSIGRMSRYAFAQHYKLLNEPSPIEPEVFDQSKLTDASYLAANCGKLMTLKGVILKDADGKKVYAPNDGSVVLTANSVNRAFTSLSSNNIVLRTSTYADFANSVMPTAAVNVTGIFTRFRNTWQILMRTLDDIQPAPTAIYSEPFNTGQGDFTIENIFMGPEISYVWSWANANYGMKASAYSGGAIAAQSRLVSPAINLSSVTSATLSFDQALNYIGGANVNDHVQVQVSTDGTTWTDLPLSGYPAGNNWDFFATTANLTSYCGKSTVYISFLYTSTATVAPTWEIKNFVVE